MAYGRRSRSTRRSSGASRGRSYGTRSRRAPARKSRRRVSRSSGGSRTVRLVIQTVAASPQSQGQATNVPLRAMF